MRMRTVGFTLGLIGMVGGIVAYLSVSIYKDIAFLNLGLLANFIQVTGLILLYGDTRS
jgi:hypothetical protein